jgi:hypothetical protein
MNTFFDILYYADFVLLAYILTMATIRLAKTSH